MMTTISGSSDPDGISCNLGRIADDFERSLAARSLPQHERYARLRYAAFVRVLAGQPVFCTALSELDVSMDMPVSVVFARIDPIIARYSLPSNEPFRWEGWRSVLMSARLGMETPSILSWPATTIAREDFELQLVYEPTIAQLEAGRRSIVSIARLELSSRSTRIEARAVMRRMLAHPLKQFLNRTRPLLKNSAHPRFGVRVIHMKRRSFPVEASSDDPPTLRFRLPSPLFHLEMLGNYDVPVPAGRRATSISSEVIDHALRLIETKAPFRAGSGRRPDSGNAAKWWGHSVFEGLSPAQIATRELPCDPDAALTRAETIERRLYELGLRPVRE